MNGKTGLISGETLLEIVDRIQTAIHQLPRSIKNHLASIMVDGSLVRGDFLPNASDIDFDVIIHNADEPERMAVKHEVWSTINRALQEFPQRAWPSKPFHPDIQWEFLEEIGTVSKRSNTDWSADNVPQGYPKLWLYAFDVKKYHRIIYGEDLTELYVVRPMEILVPIRLERIRRSVVKIGVNPSDYDVSHNTITQMRNAWESIRAAQLLHGIATIHKYEVMRKWRDMVPEFPHKEKAERVWDFYRGTLNLTTPEEVASFRRELSEFALSLLTGSLITSAFT